MRRRQLNGRAARPIRLSHHPPTNRTAEATRAAAPLTVAHDGARHKRAKISVARNLLREHDQFMELIALLPLGAIAFAMIDAVIGPFYIIKRLRGRSVAFTVENVAED